MGAAQSWDTGQSSSATPGSSEALRERYVERMLEKILRYQKQPRTRPMDVALIGMMVVTMGVVVLRTGHYSAPALAANAPLQERLDKISAQQEQLHQQLAELKTLRAQIAALKSHGTATVGLTAPPPAPRLAPPPEVHSTVPEAPPPPRLVPPPAPAEAPHVKTTVAPALAAAPALADKPADAATSPVQLGPKPGPKLQGVPRDVPAAKGPEQVHVLQAGESLWALSQKYYGDSKYLDALAHYNGIDDPGRMHVGMTIKLPPVGSLNAAPVKPASSPAATH